MGSDFEWSNPHYIEGRVPYLDDFLVNTNISLGHLSDIFYSKDITNAPRKILVVGRDRFRNTLPGIEILEEEFMALTGNPHLSYSSIITKLNLLITRVSSEIDYRNAQNVCLN
jgi:hypothetical protein